MVQAFQNWATANGVGNAALVISQDGVEIGTSVVGTWTVDTIAPIASTSKAVTAICLLTMLDSGQIALTDTIQQLLPTFTNSLNATGQANAAAITVEQLLRHTSGLQGNGNPAPPGEPTQTNYTTGAADPNPDQWFATQALNQALITLPGTSSAYANVNYAILGLIIRTVGNDTYENYCRRSVLTPRGAANARIAAGNSAMGAYGGWSMSAREYSNFYWRSFNRPALSELATNFMDSVFDPGCPTCTYGLGVGVTPIGYSVSETLLQKSPTVAFMSLPSSGGALLIPLIERANVFTIPMLHTEIPPYDLFHTGDWSGSTTPGQFSSIAAYWTNGVTAVMIDDTQLGGALGTLYQALTTPALTLN